MARKPRHKKRLHRQRRTRKMFIVSTEGAVTEPEYFDLVKRLKTGTVVHVECLKSDHKSDPLQVLDRMKNRLKELELGTRDEAWLVVDRDNWTDKELTVLQTWSQHDSRRGLAVSNPSFEYWLLLHFEDTRVNNSRHCIECLRRHVPQYDKHISFGITRRMIAEAICRARKRDNLQSTDWPRTHGSTMYRLAEGILDQQI